MPIIEQGLYLLDVKVEVFSEDGELIKAVKPTIEEFSDDYDPENTPEGICLGGIIDVKGSRPIS